MTRKDKRVVCQIKEGEYRKLCEMAEALEALNAQGIEGLKKEKEENQKEIKKLKEEKEKAQEETKELKEEKENTQKEIKELKEKHQKDIQELEEQRHWWKSWGDLHQRATCYERHLKNKAENKLEKLQKDYKSLEERLSHLQEENAGLRKSYQDLQDEIGCHTTKLEEWYVMPQHEPSLYESEDRQRLIMGDDTRPDKFENLSQHLHAVPRTYIEVRPEDSR
jgi:chromosome segregation ATPase